MERTLLTNRNIYRNDRCKASGVSLCKLFSSYEFDSDADAEQRLSERINGDATTAVKSIPPTDDVDKNQSLDVTSTNENSHRYTQLVNEVGLEGQLKQTTKLSNSRTVSDRGIFCNREIKFGSLKAIGFDMDYTLAQYKQPAFDKLAFDGAKEKLVNNLGYPKEVLDIEYNHELWVRGLIIDTQKGNFLKIDRHKYVRVAYHGLRRISSFNRKLLYSRTFNKAPSFSEKHFVNMDTLFQHVDAHLFASLIDMKDAGEHEVLDFKTYEDMYKDVRECIDLCHRDGVIKDEVARNPEKYIIPDDKLVPMLQNMKNAGVKTFLLTNSYWEYTSVAMNFLFHKKNADPEIKAQNLWTDLFDIVIVGSCKPAFLLNSFLSLYRVKPEDGSLLNTDGLYDIDALGENGAQKFLEQGKTFQGGNWMHLQAMLETKAGEEILYVGDHLYADVLRSKRTLGWRTALIIPELEDEMKTFNENKDLALQITGLRTLRDELSSYGDSLRMENDIMTEETAQILNEIEQDDEVIKGKLTEIAEKYHSAFHPVWGQMFNAGYQDSRLAFYVQNYACIYMSRATNLGLLSTERSLRTTAEMLPHDKLLLSPSTEFSQD